MGIFKEINDEISKFLCERSRNSKTSRQIEMENARRAELDRIHRLEIEKSERLTRMKYWPNVKENLYSKYQLPIADDAKNIARELFEKDLDSVSAFFITDERVVKKIYIDGGDRSIDEFAKNLMSRAFIGGPITATLLRRLKLLKDVKIDGKVIDTEIDIDGFVPFSGVMYTVDKIELDGQKIPARRKFSIRCEMTATLTEGFRTGPFVYYDGLYFSNKEEIEQITDEDLEDNKTNKTSKTNKTNKESEGSIGKKYGEHYKIDVCPHGTDKKSYCNHCHGDIIITSSKKIIGICLDGSGSMDGEKLERAKAAVIRVLERIPTNRNIQVVLIIFSEDLRVNYEEIIPFRKEYTERVKHMAINTIRKMSTNGGTPLYDTINYFLDQIWSGREIIDESSSTIQIFPYAYLIIVSDGDENGSKLEKLIYKGRMGSDGFFAKLKAYRDAGLVAEIIPFAYGFGKLNNKLIYDLRNISGKELINKADPGNILELMVSNVDSILYGSDNLKMIGLSVNKKK